MKSHTPLQPTLIQTLLTPLRHRLSTQWARLQQALNANPRLRAGLPGIVLIALCWGLLTLSDELTSKQKQLNQLLEDKAKIERQVGNNTRLKRLQEQLLTTQEDIGKGLRSASTAVIAQADFGDWLNNGLIDVGVKQLKVNQAVYRYLAEHSDADAANQNCVGAACSLVELQTQIRFNFEANTFAKALAFLEGAEKRLRISQLTVNLAEQKVELTVKTLAHITNDLDREGLQQEMQEQAHLNEQDTPTQTATQSETTPPTKKQVEIKW